MRDRAARRRLVPPGLLVLVPMLLALVLAGCGGGSKGGASTHAAAHTTPTTTTTPAPSPAMLAAGKKVFKKNCASCHTLAGRVAHPVFLESPIPNLDEVRPTAPYVRARVLGGGFDMGGFQLSPRALDAVVAYVSSVAGRNIGPNEGTGDVALGETVFEQHCQRCHSIANHRMTGHPTYPGTAFSLVRPSVKMILARLRKGIPEEMPSFRKRLTAVQRRAVAEYVSSVAGH